MVANSIVRRWRFQSARPGGFLRPLVAKTSASAAELEVDDLLLPERQLASFGRRDGYLVFPLVKEMQSKVGSRHFHGFANSGYGLGHLNAEGHKAMAELLVGKLCDAVGKRIAL